MHTILATFAVPFAWLDSNTAGDWTGFAAVFEGCPEIVQGFACAASVGWAVVDHYWGPPVCLSVHRCSARLTKLSFCHVRECVRLYHIPWMHGTMTEPYILMVLTGQIECEWECHESFDSINRCYSWSDLLLVTLQMALDAVTHNPWMCADVGRIVYDSCHVKHHKCGCLGCIWATIRCRILVYLSCWCALVLEKRFVTFPFTLYLPS